MLKIIYLSVKILLTIFACHAIGDYVLQCDYIAKTKGQNWWHLVIHSFLYIVPFWCIFGYNINLLLLFLHHFITDAAKARYKQISYVEDQVSHIVFAVLAYLIAPVIGGLIK